MSDYMDKGRTISRNYYSKLLITLSEVIVERRRGKLTKNVLFLKNNAARHKPHVAMQINHNVGFELLKHPTFSPDLADYNDVFLQLKRGLILGIPSFNEEVKEVVEAGFQSNIELFF